MSRVCVVGAGAWGTAFAQICADAGSRVTVLTRNTDVAAGIERGENRRDYPGVYLNGIQATTDPVRAVPGADLIAVAVTSQVAAGAVAGLAELIDSKAVVASLIKGIEVSSRQRMSQVIGRAARICQKRVAVISGPNLAGELIQRQPGATVVACTDQAAARRVAALVATPYLRPYTNTDVIGVEICGAMKNIVALAVGAAQGMGYGLNTMATLMTRGLAEMTRLGLAVGADLETFAGLAGFGDLAATCVSSLSRNHQVGYRLGQGLSVDQAVAATKGTAEAVVTCLAVQALARDHCVEVPITDGVVEVAHRGVSAVDMGRELLARPLREEGASYVAWSDQQP